MTFFYENQNKEAGLMSSESLLSAKALIKSLMKGMTSRGCEDLFHTLHGNYLSNH